MDDKSMFLSGASTGPETQKAYEQLKKKAASQTNAATTPTTSYASVSNVTPQNDYYAQLMAAINEQAAKRRESNIAAIDNQLKQQLAAYDQQAADLEPVYQNYRNQSEVERYKAQKALREALANRGALDSGAGRQETLDLQNNYGNNLNKINLQYQAELDAINRAKQQLQNEADYQKIQAINDADNVGLEGKIAALQSQIENQQSISRINAQAAAKKQVEEEEESHETYDRYKSYFTGAKSYNSKTALLAALQYDYQNGNISEEDVAKLAEKFNLQQYYK